MSQGDQHRYDLAHEPRLHDGHGSLARGEGGRRHGLRHPATGKTKRVRRIDRRTRFCSWNPANQSERFKYWLARIGFFLRKFSVGFFDVTSAPTIRGGGGAPSLTAIVNEPAAVLVEPTATVYCPG